MFLRWKMLLCYLGVFYDLPCLYLPAFSEHAVCKTFKLFSTETMATFAFSHRTNYQQCQGLVWPAEYLLTVFIEIQPC